LSRLYPCRSNSFARLTTSRAIVLGAVQGPAELLPVSSSAHLSLIPWFAGWGWERIAPARRKDFEVALHAGTTAALMAGQRRAIVAELRRLNVRRAGVIALASGVPAAVGFALERPIEERLGGPATIAVGLLAGATAMMLADRRPQTRGPEDLNAVDGVALGAAQAAALFPGVSRTGATVAAARWRGFSRREANLLSRTIALPVVLGATALRLQRMRQGRPRPKRRRVLATGALAALVSSLVSQKLIAELDDDSSPWPYAAYRVALAAAIAVKLRRDG
jgi:undecaprenyl-diphosphatase